MPKRAIGGGLHLAVLLVLLVQAARCRDEYDRPDECGLSRLSEGLERCNSDGRLSRIVNGDSVRPNEFPFLASIDNLCTGVIIDKRHILTTAECLADYFPSNLKPEKPSSAVRVTVGEHSRNTPDGERAVKILAFWRHPHYALHADGSIENNIALMRTVEEIKFNDYIPTVGGRSPAVGPIGLPENDWTCGCERFTVAGWGYVKYMNASDRPVETVPPRKLEVSQMPKSLCKCLLKNTFHSRLVEDSFCTAPEPAGRNICLGDSGDPLFRTKPFNGGHQLIGLASYTPKPCGNSRAPAVYTKVHPYLKWISGLMEKANWLE